MIRMQLIRKPEFTDSFFGADIERIVAAFAAQGMEISRPDAEEAWSKYSDMFAASWLYLPKTKAEIVDAIKEYFEQGDN